MKNLRPWERHLISPPLVNPFETLRDWTRLGANYRSEVGNEEQAEDGDSMPVHMAVYVRDADCRTRLTQTLRARRLT
jgi:hypothetical protein